MNLDDFRDFNHLRRSSDEGEWALRSLTTREMMKWNWVDEKGLRVVERRLDHTMWSEGGSTTRCGRKEVQLHDMVGRRFDYTTWSEGA